MGDSSSNVIPFRKPGILVANTDLGPAGEFVDHVAGMFNITFDDLLDAFRQNGSELTRFIITQDDMVLEVAND